MLGSWLVGGTRSPSSADAQERIPPVLFELRVLRAKVGRVEAPPNEFGGGTQQSDTGGAFGSAKVELGPPVLHSPHVIPANAGISRHTSDVAL